eukprot:scaffold1473_cov375-Prasinococcus_capsulatus_cf.AAC.12
MYMQLTAVTGLRTFRIRIKRADGGLDIDGSVLVAADTEEEPFVVDQIAEEFGTQFIYGPCRGLGRPGPVVPLQGRSSVSGGWIVSTSRNGQCTSLSIPEQ